MKNLYSLSVANNIYLKIFNKTKKKLHNNVTITFQTLNQTKGVKSIKYFEMNNKRRTCVWELLLLADHITLRNVRFSKNRQPRKFMSKPLFVSALSGVNNFKHYNDTWQLLLKFNFRHVILG